MVAPSVSTRLPSVVPVEAEVAVVEVATSRVEATVEVRMPPLPLNAYLHLD